MFWQFCTRHITTTLYLVQYRDSIPNCFSLTQLLALNPERMVSEPLPGALNHMRTVLGLSAQKLCTVHFAVSRRAAMRLDLCIPIACLRIEEHHLFVRPSVGCRNHENTSRRNTATLLHTSPRCANQLFACVFVIFWSVIQEFGCLPVLQDMLSQNSIWMLCLQHVAVPLALNPEHR